MKSKILLLISLFFISIGTALGQTISVKGTVLDEKGDPVMAATVRLKSDAKVGALTGMDGDFTLKAKQGEIIIVSYVGYKTQEVAAAPKLTVKLVPDAEMLDEVMVVAYGTSTREAFTGSASVISAEKIKNKSASNVTKSLEGEVPGIQVINRTGQPGASADIVIRGIGSVNSSVTPLYVVDGVPFGSSMSGINPSDIASISVLKDASATALYGSRAANGVVLITTKKGKSGDVSINADFSYGISKRLFPLHDRITSPEEYMEVAYQALDNKYNVFKSKRPKGFENTALNDMLFSKAGILPRYNMWNAPAGEGLIDPTTGKFNSKASRIYTPEAWEDYIFRLGQRYEGNVSLSGGTAKFNSFTSAGIVKDQGYYIGSDFTRFNIRNNSNYNVSDKITAGVNLSYSRLEQNSPGQGDDTNNGFNFVNSMPTIYPVFEHDEKGNLIPDDRIPGQNRYDYGQFAAGSRNSNGGINPAGAITLDRKNSINHLVSLNSNIDWRFYDHFKLSVNTGYQYQGGNINVLTNPYYGNAEGIGRLYRYRRDYNSLTFNQILSYANKWGDHNLDAFVAHESFSMKYATHYSYKHGAILGDQMELDNFVVMGDLSSYSFSYALESYFGQIKYDFANKYFLNASIRTDGSSRFAKENRWGVFGSVGGAWVISREDFMKGVKWINELKLKASWGLIGNQDIALGYGSDIPDYYLDRDFFSMSNLGDKPSFTFYSKGNKALTWEKSSSWNVGLDAKLFKRINMSLEWFRRNTTDMLFKKQVSPSLGYAYYPSNDGVLVNSGVELDLSADVVKTDDWNFNVRLNLGHYRNKLTRMPSAEGSTEPKHYERRGAFAWAEGHSIYDHYTRRYLGVDPENGKAQYKALRKLVKMGPDNTPEYEYITDYEDHIAKGKSLDGFEEVKVYDATNAVKEFVGKSALPDLTGGFGFDLRYKNVSLATSFSYSLGGYSYDAIYQNMMHSGRIGTHNWHKDIHNAWTPKNKNTDVPALSDGITSYKYGNATSDRFLTSRSYLTLSNIRLTYNIPTSLLERVNIKSASVYVSGDNLFILTARKGFYSGTSISGGTDNSNNTQERIEHRYIPSATMVAGIKLGF